MFEQAYGGQGVDCDGLHMLGQGSGTVWRCGLVGAHPGLLKRLFELEVPEIQEGTVEIKL